MTRVIGISSGKGGVGKTTVVANLALALRKLGKSVVMVDCNLSTPHLSYYLGVNDYKKTINDVMRETADIKSAMYNYDGVKFIPASLSLKSLVGLDLKKFKKTISEIVGPKVDYVLLDSAPGLGREAVCVLNAADEILFVTTPFIPMVNDVLRCIDVLKQLGKKKVGVVLNMSTGGRHELFSDSVEGVLGVPVVGEIPFEKKMPHSLVTGTPIMSMDEGSASSTGFMMLAATLSGEKYQPPGIVKRTFGAFRSALGSFSNMGIAISQDVKNIESEMFIEPEQNSRNRNA